MAFQTEILDALLDWHLDVVPHDGWQSRGSSIFDPRGHILHHDVIGHTETLPGSMINGRVDPPLAGPLCNFWLARSGTVHLVAAGEANHAGDGGFKGMSGNASVWGTEMNNLGVPDDPWPDEQLEAMATLAAATAEFSGFGADTVCAHREWTTRKIDPHTIDMAAFRSRVTAQTKEGFSIVDDATRKYFDAKFEAIQKRDRLIRESQINHGERLRAIRKAQGATDGELDEIDGELAAIRGALDD